MGPGALTAVGGGGERERVGALRQPSAVDLALEGELVPAGAGGVGQRAAGERPAAADVLAIVLIGRLALPGDPVSEGGLGEREGDRRGLVERECEAGPDRRLMVGRASEDGLPSGLAPSPMRLGDAGERWSHRNRL